MFRAIFYDFLLILSIASNGLLIILVLRTKHYSLGSYRRLILVFAIHAIFTSIVHHATQLRVLIADGNIIGYPSVADLYRSENGWKGKIACTAFILTSLEAFLLLAYHYVYRLKIVDSVSSAQHWNPSIFFRVAIVLNIIYSSLTAAAAQTVLAPSDRSFVTPAVAAAAPEIDLNDPSICYIAAIFRRVDTDNVASFNYPAIAGIAVIVVLELCTSVVIVFCIVKIRRRLNGTTHLSAKTRHMQRQLLFGLLIQSFIPCFFSYVPICVTAVSATAGFSLDADFMILSTAIFPAIDALFVVAFIRPYRKALLTWLHSTRKMFIHASTTVVPYAVSSTSRNT